MRCYYLNFTNHRFNKCQETSRERKRSTHLITSCTYIIQQYTIVYLKNTKLSTKEIRNCQQNEFPKKSINTTTLKTKKNIFHYSVVKADQQPDKMSEQSIQHF